MNTKIVAALAVFCFIAVSAVPFMGGADAESADGYASQLDSNGTKVYQEVGDRFDNEINGTDPQGTLSFLISLSDPVLFATAEEAVAYAQGVVSDALAAIYYTDPEAVWLWDLPVSAPEVSVNTGTAVVTYESSNKQPATYHLALTVSFTVSVPADMADDASTEANEIYARVMELRDARTEVSGTVSGKVQAIADRLRSVSVEESAEGEVGNVYDALIGGSSSTEGIAAAFTYLCAYNGIDVLTVRGVFMESSDPEENALGCWNIVRDDDGAWYAVDVTMYGGDRAVLMEGAMDFASKRMADLDLSAPNSLVPVQISQAGFEWPDDRTFFELHGIQILLGAILVVVVVTMVYAARRGDF